MSRLLIDIIIAAIGFLAGLFIAYIIQFCREDWFNGNDHGAF